MKSFLSPEEYKILADNQYKMIATRRTIDDYKERIDCAKRMETVHNIADELYDYALDEEVKEAIDKCHDKIDEIQMIEALE